MIPGVIVTVLGLILGVYREVINNSGKIADIQSEYVDCNKEIDILKSNEFIMYGRIYDLNGRVSSLEICCRMTKK